MSDLLSPSAVGIPSQRRNAYRWVIALSGGIGVCISVLAIPVFGNAIPVLAKQWGVGVGEVASYGMDSFALGVLFAFFVSHSGIFHGRTKVAMSILVIAQVIPLLLIPELGKSLWLLALLRFFMGWGLSSMGLQAALTSRWFGHGERALSMALTAGVGIFALTPGGYIAGFMSTLGLRATFGVAAAAVFGCYVIYMIFSRDPSALEDEKRPGDQVSGSMIGDLRMVWSCPDVWLLGIGGNTQTWSLFTVGAFLPVFFIHAGKLSLKETGNVMSLFGVFILFVSFAGAAISAAVLRRRQAVVTDGRRRDNAALRNRLVVMIGSNVMMLGGFTLLYFLSLNGAVRVGFGQAVLSVSLIAFLALNSTAFWVAIGDLFPPERKQSAMVTMAVLAVGMVAQIGSVVGPFSSSALASTGWPVIFLIAGLVQLLGIAAVAAILVRIARRGQVPFAHLDGDAREAKIGVAGGR